MPPRLLVTSGLLGLAVLLIPVTAFETAITLERDGDRVALTVDGHRIEASVPASNVTGLEIQVPDSVYRLGGGTLRVRSGGRELFAETLPRVFRLPEGPVAPVGDWYVDLQAARGTVYSKDVALGDRFTLEVTFTGRSSERLNLLLRGSPVVGVHVRRGLLAHDMVISGGGAPVAAGGASPGAWSSVRTAFGLLLRCVLAGAILVGLFRVLAFLLRNLSPPRLPAMRVPAVAIALAIASLALALRLHTASTVLERLPHTPDEVTYLVQAKWLAGGHAFRSAPAIADHLTVPWTYVKDGKWFGLYPPGWPLLLAAGLLAGSPWVVGPVCGALTVFVTWLVGRELYDDRAGLLAAVFTALSPVAILLSASFLSHASCALMVALFVWGYLAGRRRGSGALLLTGGLAVGYAGAIRPMTAIAVAAAVSPFLLADLLRTGGRGRSLRHAAALVAGGLLGAAPALLYNRLVTGSPFTFAYSYALDLNARVADVPRGLVLLDATLASTLPAVLGWGWGILQGWSLLTVGLAVASLPFLCALPRRTELFLLCLAACLPLAHLLWAMSGLHGYGPRLYSEGFLAIFILAARGLVLLGLPRQPGPGSPAPLLAGVLTAVLVLSAAVTLPARLRLFRGYNGVDGRLERRLQELPPGPRLVLLPSDGWWSWGRVVNLWDGDPGAPLAFAVSLGDDARLLSYYSGREVTRVAPPPPTRVAPPPPTRVAPPPPTRVGPASPRLGHRDP